MEIEAILERVALNISVARIFLCGRKPNEYMTSTE